MREHFMYIMSCTWSVMNNTLQICIYGHPGLARYKLAWCSGWSALLHPRNLMDFIYDEARPMCWELQKHNRVDAYSRPQETSVRCKKHQQLHSSGLFPESSAWWDTRDSSSVHAKSTCLRKGLKITRTLRRPQTSPADKSTTPINHPSTKCFPAKSPMGFGWPFICQWHKLFK